MKINNLLIAFSLVTFFFLSSCEKEPLHSNFDDQSVEVSSRAKKKGKGGGNNAVSSGQYVLTQAADDDVLSSFSIKGNKVTLFSDPNNAGRGTDNYGFWSSSFNMSNNSINYTIGLGTTTYNFVSAGSSSFNVTKIVVVLPYQSNGTPITTTSNVGLFTK